MAVTENKYQLGTAENQKFLQDVRDGLLSFGHQFPSPGGNLVIVSSCIKHLPGKM